MIHICYGIYDKDGRYSKFVGTSITSIFENTNSDVTIHILHDDTLSEENRDKFFYLAGHYSQKINFHNVEKLVPEKIAELREKLGEVSKTKFSIGALYRLLIPQIFSQEISKVIYLDADIIVNLDIKELWQIELKEKILGAVPEIEIDVPTKYKLSGNYLLREKIVAAEDYFNSGVLLLNVNRLRKEEKNFFEGIKFVAEHDCGMFDQDILNYCFSKNYFKLPPKFDIFVNVERSARGNVQPGEKIYHYIADTLNLDCNDKLNALWLKYFSKTPWFNFEMINNISDGIKKLYIEQKNFAVKISAIISGKERAFFVHRNNLEAVKNIFGIKDSEEIIFADSPDSLKKLVQAVGSGDKLFFILVSNYSMIQSVLSQQGFVQDKNFIDGLSFLSDAYGIPFNSHSLIKIL